MDSAQLDLSSKLKLSDGTSIPLFGLGTYLTSSEKEGLTANSVEFALSNGYRLIDTAQMYKNEAEVGVGIKNSGVPREEIYVVTKLTFKGNKEHCKKTFMESLDKLKTGYVDLYLIHTPKGGHNLDAYDAMLELQKEGLIRSIGVSNYGVEHLEELKKAGKPTPIVNQIELHPFCRHESAVDYCNKNNIAVMGFCPLARAKFFDEPAIVEIASKHSKSPAQVMLRWSIQKDFITIPKSGKAERIKANADIFDFQLDESDMAKLASLRTEYVTPLRLDIPWEG